MKVLVVDDDAMRASVMRRALRRHAVVGDVARSAEDAVWMAAAAHYDAISLEAALRGADGLAACRRLREARVGTPIVMLVPHDAVARRIAGLDAGADDCLAKPFHFAELLARLRALARRAPRKRPPVLSVGDLRFDLASCEVRRGEREILLTPKERGVLEVLMRNAGQAVSRHELLEAAWDGAPTQRSNVVDVYVRYLRQKVDRPFGLRTIETVPGVGYRLDAA